MQLFSAASFVFIIGNSWDLSMRVLGHHHTAILQQQQRTTFPQLWNDLNIVFSAKKVLCHNQQAGYSPSSMSSSVLLWPSAIATFPLMTGFCVILGGSSASPAFEGGKNKNTSVTLTQHGRVVSRQKKDTHINSWNYDVSVHGQYSGNLVQGTTWKPKSMGAPVHSCNTWENDVNL